MIHGDIALSDALDQVNEPIDSVIHLAGRIYDCTGVPCVIDNVYTTYAIFEWARCHGVRRIVYISTMGVNTPSADDELMSECTPVKPTSLYALTKYLGEEILSTGTLSHIILRPTFVYGPGDTKGFVARLHQAITTSSLVQVREEARDFLHVDDLVDAIVRSVLYEGSDTTFCLGSGTRAVLHDLAQAMALRHGTTSRLANVQGRIQGRVDWSLARSQLDWRPTKTLQTLYEGPWC
jgi:UDP-glucose 4-epimerase